MRDEVDLYLEMRAEELAGDRMKGLKMVFPTMDVME